MSSPFTNGAIAVVYQQQQEFNARVYSLSLDAFSDWDGNQASSPNHTVDTLPTYGSLDIQDPFKTPSSLHDPAAPAEKETPFSFFQDPFKAPFSLHDPAAPAEKETPFSFFQDPFETPFSFHDPVAPADNEPPFNIHDPVVPTDNEPPFNIHDPVVPNDNEAPFNIHDQVVPTDNEVPFSFINDPVPMDGDVPILIPPMPSQHADIERDLKSVYQLTRTSAFSPMNPTGIDVYTMTINIDPVNGICGQHPNFVSKFCVDEDHYMCVLNQESRYKFVRQDFKKMKNSIILKTTRSSSCGTNIKVMKIFNNAKVQMNGLQSHEDVQMMVHLYKHLLKTVYSVSYIVTGAPRVSMVNGRFNTNTTLDLGALFAVCKESDQSVVMNLELHPAMRLKAGSATVFVFSSGKVLIMGSKAPSDMTLGFNNIMRIISQNHSRVYMDPVLIVGKKSTKKKL
jgi:TATA-box binding protein (TBP) (component of TFIID and TFIIIB)